MKKLLSQQLPPNLFTVASLAPVRELAISTRQLALAGTAGYPVGSHVVGRMQKQIRLNSFRELLESILQLRNLAKLAADILFTAPAARIDKQQFVRTELLTYVDEQTKLYGFKDLTEQDRDLIAYMIASTESPDTSWVLDYDLSSSNRIIQLHKLLDALRNPEPTVNVISGKKRLIDFKDMVAAGMSPIYDPETDSIRHISETKKYTRRVNDLLADTIGNASEDPGLIKSLEDLHENSISVLNLSYVRVWDHIAALLTTTDIWNSFVSPRLKTDETSNMERARSLRSFSTYLHSILMYPHFFAIEAFRSTYDLLQENVVAFPPLPVHLVTQYENIIAKHDLLGAAGDVTAVFSRFKAPSNAIAEVSISILPKEFITIYGFDEAIAKAEQAAANASVPVDITDLKTLNDEIFAPLTLAHPVDRFDVVHEIADRVLIKGIVSNFILEACGAILPGVPKFFSDEAMTALKQLSLIVGYSLDAPLAVTSDPTTSSLDSYDGHNLKYLPLSPAYSYSLRRTVRKDLLYKVDTNTNILDKLNKDPRVIKMVHKASDLRRATGKEWSTLMPAQWLYSDEYFATPHISGSRPLLERMLETLTGMNIELIERTIGNPYSRELFATYLSGFALLYYFPAGIKKEADVNLALSGLISGYGMPYGTSYNTLEAKQPAPKMDDFIAITSVVYMRILNVVPVPTNSLNASTEFMVSHPHYYYSSNSALMTVDRWVIAPGLSNFALAPVPKPNTAAKVLLDKRYAYLNQALLIQANMIWTPVPNTDNTVTLSLVNRAWNREKNVPNLEYITLTNYGRETEIKSKLETNEEEDAIVKLVAEMEKETKTIIEKAPSNNPDKAPVSPIDPNTVTNLGNPLAPIAPTGKTFGGNQRQKKNGKK